MSRLCVVLGCDRAAREHYTRCLDHIQALLDSHLPKPEKPVVVRRAEQFRLVSK